MAFVVSSPVTSYGGGPFKVLRIFLPTESDRQSASGAMQPHRQLMPPFKTGDAFMCRTATEKQFLMQITQLF
jgi:hypothetical protein